VCGREQISLSVGIAVFPDDGVDAEQLLAHADRRMYFAKRAHYEEAASPPRRRAPQPASRDPREILTWLALGVSWQAQPKCKSSPRIRVCLRKPVSSRAGKSLR